MFNTMKKTAWAATLAMGGVLAIGTVAAVRADDDERGDRPRNDHASRPTARRDGHDQKSQPSRPADAKPAARANDGKSADHQRAAAGRGEIGRAHV